ncbi:MAG: hypothetical protein AAF409_04490, partial [Pseudomonadota bacterium]
RGVIKSDPFVVVRNAICAFDLAPVLAKHNGDVTVVLSEGGNRTRHKIRPTLEDDLVVVLEDGRAVGWDVAHSNFVDVPLDFSTLSVRSDLTDSRVDVCSPEVLWRYSENFDYQDSRRDFIVQEVGNVELGQKVHVHIAQGYVGVVTDPRSLNAVAEDIRNGWFDPNALPPPPEHDVIQSSLGPRCKVGAGTHVEYAVLANDVTLGDNVYVPRGCVIGPGVNVEDGTKLEPYTRLPAVVSDEDDHEEARRAGAPGGDPDLERRRADLWRDVVWDDVDDDDDDDFVVKGDDVFTKTVRDMMMSAANSPVDSLVMEINCYKLPCRPPLLSFRARSRWRWADGSVQNLSHFAHATAALRKAMFDLGVVADGQLKTPTSR